MRILYGWSYKGKNVVLIGLLLLMLPSYMARFLDELMTQYLGIILYYKPNLRDLKHLSQILVNVLTYFMP